MSLNNGFYYYTYCNYNGQRHTIDLSEELQLHTFRMAQKYGVQYELVMAVMGVESGWDEDDRGNGTFVGLGAIYVAQLKELKSIGITDLYDPEAEHRSHLLLFALQAGLCGRQRAYGADVLQQRRSRRAEVFQPRHLSVSLFQKRSSASAIR